MSPPDRASWASASPFLDTALELPAADRARWLDELRQRSPDLAAQVDAWLAELEALDSADFLEDAASVESTRAALSGMALGPYRLISPIGHGGMGTVWLAERADGRYEGRVAVKLLNPSLVGRTGEERFAREGRVLARLSHPQIAHLIDAGVSSVGQPYLVLEFVDGEPIDHYCDRQRLDVDARVRLFLDVLAPVGHAHANLVVHRDLKPANVLVTGGGQVKLLDFGIARLIEPDGAHDERQALTVAGDALLTPAFAAPEQVMRQPVSTATDVYALGVLLYLLLAGRHPGEPSLDVPADLLRTIVDGEPPRMSERVVDGDPRLRDSPGAIAERRRTAPDRLRQALRGDLDTIVATALKKKPDERYASVAAFAEDLRRWRDHEPIAARADSTTYRLWKFLRRNRVAAVLGVAALLALVAGIAGTLSQAARAAAERDFALRQLARAESINDMNSFLLSDAAPLGRSFTAGDLLSRAEALLNRHPGAPDENLVESLVSIGLQYWNQDEDDNARRVLTRAYDLSRHLPASSAAIRAKAACALASGLARGDDLPRARQLSRDALAELPPGTSFALDRVFCLRRAATVARDAGDFDADVAYTLEADRTLRESGLGSELASLSMAMDVAEAYRNAGRNQEASRAFEASFAKMKAMGRERTEQAGTLLNNWGLTNFLLGQPRQAERMFREAVDIGSADAAGASVSPMLLLNLARPVLELARTAQGLEIAERGAAEATRLGDRVVRLQSQLVRAGGYRELGDYDRADALLREFEQEQRGRLPDAHPAFSTLASEMALLRRARGDLTGALEAANRAVAIAEANPNPGAILPRALLRRADLARERGDVPAAVADAERGLALELARLDARSMSSMLGRAYLTVARARLAAGRTTEARDAARLAQPHLDAALGPDHRDAVANRDLLQTLR